MKKIFLLSMSLTLLGCQGFPSEPTSKLQTKKNQDLVTVCVWWGGKKICNLVDKKELERELNVYPTYLY